MDGGQSSDCLFLMEPVLNAVSRSHRRILMYSHDSFGLGHLRRCREIAHALVQRRADVSILIISGSPIIGSYDFRANVDFVRVPGVIKLQNGNYESLSEHLNIDETLAIRESIIRHTAKIFRPDIFIVDKEPLGLRGEIRDTLDLLRDRGCRLVLGLRDIMDDPDKLLPEWRRKKAMPALENLYHNIWVYGLESICDPLAGMPVTPAVRDKMVYTGYLHRQMPDMPSKLEKPFGDKPFLLVTPGGGGDGSRLIEWVLEAYEQGGANLPPALIVTGPFMHDTLRDAFRQRAEALPDQLRLSVFDSNLEVLSAQAAGIVGMGGYNTFCEILSFDKPGLLVPRQRPRMEQTIRALKARDLGLMQVLEDDNQPLDGAAMARELAALPTRPRPSSAAIPGLMDGLDVIGGMVDDWFRP